MENYYGFKNVTLSDEELQSFFCDSLENKYGFVQNEYLVAHSKEGDMVGVRKFNGEKFVDVPFKEVSSEFFGKIKARNIHQRLALDLLYDENIPMKVITGRFGTGKDFLMCAAAADLLERGKYDKIVFVRNNIEVKDSKPIGHLPGTMNDKLRQFAMPLADHLGGSEGLNALIDEGKVEIAHLGFLRGRDIRNSIIYCTEAENMTVEHIQLLISRASDGSTVWINGDFKQCDAEVFRRNSGLMRAVEKLKGNKLFGYVNLIKTERSELAALADLLD